MSPDRFSMNRLGKGLFIVAALALLISGRSLAAVETPSPDQTNPSASNTVSAKGRAVVRSTRDPDKILGVVVFEETDRGLRVEGRLRDLPPGMHGFHIHEYGSCENGGKAAGGHYNPTRAPHGFWPQEGRQKSHAGDMGNVLADVEGRAHSVVILPDMGLVSGQFNVAGRAVIIHEQADDFGQPTGNAGARLGCGSIVLVGE